jgi:hypothetical protein
MILGWPIHLWVFEANSGARRLYDALGGKAAVYQLKPILEGIEIPSVLYIWDDVDKLSVNLIG